MTLSTEVRQTALAVQFDDKNLELLRDTICKGATEQEFELFIHACKRTGLDPFAKQIYAVKRWDSTLKREAMAVQTGIDGYRLVADRTDRYAPGRKPTYTYKEDGKLLAATAYVKKLTKDGMWHEVEAEALFDEYCQKTKDGNPVSLWGKMPHVMLAKCAEALAIRKCFPAELSGIYTQEEMQQADIVVENIAMPKKEIDMTPITKSQLDCLTLFIDGDEVYLASVIERLAKLKIMRLEDIPAIMFEKVLNDAKKNFEKREEARFGKVQNENN
ncbi:bet_lambda, phage recombination protein Bet [uncultured Caudovirales phage]|uniref:Bet_lambda, phage recombination protein Bet n=1 Tax=uncultured Caudovirales phage TaxID=2100421 RepID=A0A6J5P335_9CAUD|nr:bet_lambda, phage recombination protein Bet [uncultured Caudovirales phage]